MKREDLKKATELDKSLIKLSEQIEAWKESVKFNGFDGKVQIVERGLSGNYHNINLTDIPFSDLSKFYVKKLEEKYREIEFELNTLLQK